MIKIENKDNFRPFSDKIVGVGVAATAEYNVTKSVQVEVGMKRQLDSIQIAGFVSKDDTTNVVTSLPSDFAKDTWYLVFKGFDQNGNPLETNEYDAKDDLTITSRNPMTLKMADKSDTVDLTKDFSTTKIDGKTDTDAVGSEIVTDYKGMLVEPGDWVDKGGEVSLMIVPTKTGNVAEKVFVIGEAPLLSSLEITGAVDSDGKETEIADGDGWYPSWSKGVKLAYEALDTKGNKVTSYETIVRSSNTLNLNASGGGTVNIVEENDGTAGIYWKDDESRQEYDPAVVKEKVESKEFAENNGTATTDGAPRYLTITTVVIGGAAAKTKQILINDARIPQEIIKVKADSYVMQTGEVKFNPTAATDSAGLVFQDQYGKEMDKDRAAKFFKKAQNGWEKSGKKYFAVKVDVPKENVMDGFTGDRDAIWTYDSKDVTFTPVWDAAKAGTDTIRFSVASIKDDDFKKYGYAADKWNEEGNAKAHSITYVPRKDVQNFYVKGLDNLYQIEAKWSGTRENSGKDAIKNTMMDSNAKFVAGNPTYEVYGKYNGNDVKVPFGKGWLNDGADTRFKIDDETDTIGELKRKLTGGNTEITGGSLFDYGTVGYPAKNVGYDVKIAIAKDLGDNLAALQAAQTMEALAKIYLDVDTDNTGSADGGALKALKTAQDDLKAKVDALEGYTATVTQTAKTNVNDKITALGNALNNDNYWAVGVADTTKNKAKDALKDVTKKIKTLTEFDYANLVKFKEIFGNLKVNGAAKEDFTSEEYGILANIMPANASLRVGGVNAYNAGIPGAINDLMTALKAVGSSLTLYSGAVYAFSEEYDALVDRVEVAELSSNDVWRTVVEAYANFETMDSFKDEDLQTAFNGAIDAFKAEATALNKVGAGEKQIANQTDITDVKTSLSNVSNEKYVIVVPKLTAATDAYDKIYWANEEASDTKTKDADNVATAYRNIETGLSGSGVEGAVKDAAETVADLIFADSADNRDATTDIDDIDSIDEAKYMLKTAGALTGNVDTVYKEVKVCAAPSVATKIIMDSTMTLNPTGTKLDPVPGNNAKDYTDGRGKNLGKRVIVVDQYGNQMTDEKIIFTVSDYKEATGRETHLVGDVQVDNNGNEKPTVTNAEIGDTFTLTAKVNGKSITATCKVKVGADTLANIWTDKDFRKDILKMIR